MLIMCLFTSSGQVLVKKGINNKTHKKLFISSGGLLIITAPLLYLKVLKEVGLSNAYGLNGISYLFIYIMAMVFLKEKGSLFQTIGILLITIGVIIWST